MENTSNRIGPQIAANLSVAQSGSGEEGSDAFRHATAVGGSWTFATMIVIVSVAICCLIAAFRIGAKRK